MATQFTMPRRVELALLCLFGWLVGCSLVKPPEQLLTIPKDFPATWRGRQLFHTPHAYIYAANDLSAGDADRWVQAIDRHVQRKFKRPLGKGLVLVMEPGDEPFARTLEDQIAMERDPAVMKTRPRHPKPVSETRERLRKEGIPEEPVVRGSCIPLSPSRLESAGLHVPPMPWALAAPSHELAVETGVAVTAAAMRKNRPNLTEAKARQAASSSSWIKNMMAKPFEVGRGPMLFTLWAQRQDDWSDDQRCNAIRTFIKRTFASEGLPAPKEDDLEW